jgi:hypothetical protein
LRRDEFVALARKAWAVLAQYPVALYGSLKYRRVFADVRTYCMFVGYPRSGHSVVGRLLDAHPEAVIAHQGGALQFVHAGFSRAQIFALLLRNSRLFTEGGSAWSGYTCHVATQWQGRFRKLHVIGDKSGQGATLRLAARPWLRQQLDRRVGCSVKYIHVVRNPYDNISTMHRRAQERQPQSELEASISEYFSLCETVAHVRGQIDEADWLELRHEPFIDSPKAHLAGLCGFLDVTASRDYLDDCADVVFKAPHRSRFEVDWSPALIETVERQIERFPFLRGYAYGRKGHSR